MTKTIAFWVLMCLSLPQILLGATANIVRVDGKTVEIDVGATRGITVGMTADVLTESGHIVHPVTGEDYGVRRVKIGEIKIEKVAPESAIGRLTVVYAPVKMGDTVDGLAAQPSAQDRMQMDIDEARAEIKALASNLADEIKNNKKAIDDLRQTLQRVGSSEQRLKSVMNAVQNMREHMVLVEGRVSALEQKQQAMIARDTAEVDVLKKVNINDMGVLQRGDGQDVFLQVGNRTYRLNFEANQIEETKPPVAAMQESATAAQPAAPPAQDGQLDALFPAEQKKANASTPWFLTWWVLGGVFLFIGLLAGGAILMVKKKRSAGSSQVAGGAMGLGAAGFEEVGEDAMVDELPDDLPELEPAEAEEEN